MTHSGDNNRQISNANLLQWNRLFLSISRNESTISSKYIIGLGTAFDGNSGVQKVEVFEHTFPFNDQFPYRLANQVERKLV